MKRRYLLLAVLLFFQSQIKAQSWKQYNPTQSYDVNSIAIQKPGVIAIGGGGQSPAIQTMFYTNDYGAIWNENPADGSSMPCNKSIAFADSMVGFGVGDNGAIIKSIDGGSNWTTPGTTPTTRTLNKVVCVNALTYYAVGGQKDSVQTVVKTTDGGQTWNVVYEHTGQWLTSVSFQTALAGIAVGDSGTILTTSNGGSSWTVINTPVIRDFSAVTFINSTTGYISGGTSNDSLRTILKTINGGATWTVVKDERGAKLNDIYFVNNVLGYATGDSAALLKSTDGGQTWAPQIVTGTSGAESFNAVRFYDAGFGVVAGKGGALYLFDSLQRAEMRSITMVPDDSISLAFQASVNSHNFPVHLSFEFALDSAFTQSANFTYSVNITNDSFFNYIAYTTGIHPNTLYYYKALLISAAGNIESGIYTFYLGNTPYGFRGTPATNVTSTGAQINALVNKMPVPLQLKFNYGTTPSLGSVAAANPSSVSDTLLHTISANLTGLQPNTRYYYLLEGNGVTNFYSDTVGFYTGLNTPFLQTLDAVTTDSNVSMNGQIENFEFPVKLSFKYGTSLSMDNELSANPFWVSDTAQHYITQFTNNIIRDTLYYFCLKGISAGDTIYGDTLRFYSGFTYSNFRTMPATNISNTGGVLNGSLNDLHFAANMSFQYGNTPALGNEIAAIPATVSDTLQHYVYAALNGLQTGLFCYYRLKATTLSGLNFYGETKHFFVAVNEIPNWDFQYWQNQTVQLPEDWRVFGNGVARVPGHLGNNAIQLTQNTFLLNGYFHNRQTGQGPDFFGGQPFQSRPDSVSLYVNTNIAPGDSAGMLVELKGGGTDIVFQPCRFPASTGGQFQRLSFPLTYLSPNVPDSLILIFTPSELTLGSTPSANNPNSSLTIDDISFSSTAPAVNNGGFENWYPYSFNSLLNWISPDLYQATVTHATAPSMVTQTYFDPPSDLAGSVQSFVGAGRPNEVLGASLLLTAGLTNNDPYFPVYGRHETLNGYYQFYPVNDDSLSIYVAMFKHGQLIGGGGRFLKDSVTTFTKFEVSILYQDSTIIPDSASIQVSAFASNEAMGPSRFVVDKFNFDNSYIDSIPASVPAIHENGISVYPNPAQNRLIVEIGKVLDKEGSLQVLNMSGQVVLETVFPVNERKFIIDMSSIPNGLYLLNLNSAGWHLNKKVAIIR